MKNKSKTGKTGVAGAMPETTEEMENAVASNINLDALEDDDLILESVDVIEIKMLLKAASA